MKKRNRLTRSRWWYQDALQYHAETPDDVRVFVIDKALGESWLLRNRINRPMSEYTIRKLSGMLLRGEQMLTGEPIIFDRDGNLLDGQHRLMAIVRTNVPLKSYVVFDREPAAFEAIGNVLPRRTSDALALLETPRYRSVAVIAGMVHRWLLGYSILGSNVPVEDRGSTQQIVKLIREFRDLPNAADVAQDCRYLSNPALFGFVFFLAHRIDGEKAARFFEQIVKGEALVRTDPAYQLRERMKQQTRTHKISRLAIAAHCIQAWNAFFENSELKLLRWKGSDAFPAMLGDSLHASRAGERTAKPTAGSKRKGTA